MTKKITNKLKYLLTPVSLLLPSIALAQSYVQEGLRSSSLQSLFGFGGGGLSSSSSLSELIANGIRLFLMFSGAIAIVFVIIGGFMYITSNGNEEQAEKGKNTLINAIIGVVIIIMSYVIINVITNLVSTPSGNGY